MDLLPTIVGLDFCHFEEGYPPASTRAFFRRRRRDNELRPERALDVAYHVGEKCTSINHSKARCAGATKLRSWVRMRLGHCTALGLDPEDCRGPPVPSPREGVGQRTLGSDRLRFAPRRLNCEDFGVPVDDQALMQERSSLSSRPSDALVCRAYDPLRLEAVRRRQDFVLSRLARARHRSRDLSRPPTCALVPCPTPKITRCIASWPLMCDWLSVPMIPAFSTAHSSTRSTGSSATLA